MTQAAALKIASDVAEYGLGTMVDRVLDRMAYGIAKHIVQQEAEQQEKL